MLSSLPIDSYTLTYACSVLLCALLGFFALPECCDKMLRKKHAQITGAFDRQLAAYKEFEADPASVDAATESRVTKWARDMARMESIGKVEPRMAVKLAEAGIIAEARPAEEYVNVPEEMWKLDATPKSRTVCGLALTALGALMTLPWLIHPAPAAICAPVCVALLFVAVLAVACDVRAKVIPYQLCALAAIPSAALMVLTNNAEGFAPCIASALIATLGLWGFSKLGQLFGIKGAIGMGDIRLLPWICLPLGANGTAYGLFFCFALMFVWAICVIIRQKASKGGSLEKLEHIKENKAGYAMAFVADPLGKKNGKGKRNTYLAMGPGLALWLAAGFACSYLAPPFWL